MPNPVVPVSCGKDGNTAGGVPERSAGMEAKAGSVDSLVFFFF